MDFKIADTGSLTPISMRSAGREFARLNLDGSATIDWTELRRVAATYDPDHFEQGPAIARLVWEAANPGVKP